MANAQKKKTLPHGNCNSSKHLVYKDLTFGAEISSCVCGGQVFTSHQGTEQPRPLHSSFNAQKPGAGSEVWALQNPTVWSGSENYIYSKMINFLLVSEEKDLSAGGLSWR